MAKVLRCPACGALWRVKDDFAEPTVRCSECQAIFSADKMENVIVPDEKLDERLKQQAAAQNPSQTSAESGEATMTALAGSLAEFDARATPEAPANEATSKPSSSHPVLWTLGTLVVLVGAGAAGLLYGHQTVLKTVPQLRPVYEKVCTSLPCPNFVWQDADAFRVVADIEMPLEGASVDEIETARRLPTVIATLSNRSDRPQTLPILELKLLDLSGAVMAQRVLEPVDYGFTGNDVVAPGTSVTARLRTLEPLPYDAARAQVTPVATLQ